jgi:hypothetical protein
LEDRLPAVCEHATLAGQAQPFGVAAVYPETAKRLLDLRTMLGHWVVPADLGGYRAVTETDVSDDIQ